MNRASLLRALVELLPEEILHAGKKLTSLEQTASGVKLSFGDGTTADFAAVIGADGAFSAVRKYIPEDEAGNHDASPAGWWDCRNLVPIQKAKAALGENSFLVDREYCWAGNGAFMMHSLVENGNLVQCIMTIVERDFPPDRKRVVSRDALESAFTADWLQPVTKGMIEVSYIIAARSRTE